jgi:hypothetical protein
VGDRQARFPATDSLTVELRINPGEGLNHRPEYRTARVEIGGQRNFAFDFAPPQDVVATNDVRATLRSAQPIRSAILYVRARLIAGLGPRPVAPLPAQRGSLPSNEQRHVGTPDPVKTGSAGGRPRLSEDDPEPPTPRKSRLSS